MAINKKGKKMELLNGIIKFYSFLTGLWEKISKEKQEQILSTIADGFDAALRAFFQLFKKEEAKTGNANNGQESQERTQDA